MIENSELVILWGCNPMVTLKNSWNVPDHVGQTGFEALKQKGTRVISIDPVHSDSAKFVNAQWIAPRPYTDGAMLIGIAHTLLTEKLHNPDFLKTYTVGFDKFGPTCWARATAWRKPPNGRPTSAASMPTRCAVWHARWRSIAP